MPKKDESPCETVWLQNPTALLSSFTITTLDICESNNINAFTRGTLLFVLIGLVLGLAVGPVSLVFSLLAVLILYRKWLWAKVYPEQKVSIREPFASKPVEAVIEPVEEPEFVTRPGVAVSTKPTAENPFMNVLLDEISYNPTRPPAQDSTDPRNQVVLEDYFRVQWFNDPTDVFGKSQGQRQFYTTPSTSIPNDQGSYANWLYLIPGKTCKEGGSDACVPGTNGAVVPWLSQPN